MTAKCSIFCDQVNDEYYYGKDNQGDCNAAVQIPDPEENTDDSTKQYDAE